MSKKPNLIGFARQALPNEGKIFVTTTAISDGGITSFRVYTSTDKDGEVTLRDITKTLKGVEGADGKFRGRPRNDAVIRAQGTEHAKASTVLGRQIASALYGAEGKITVQAL